MPGLSVQNIKYRQDTEYENMSLLTFREEYRVAARGEAEGADPERVHGKVHLDIPGEKKKIHRCTHRCI